MGDAGWMGDAWLLQPISGTTTRASDRAPALPYGVAIGWGGSCSCGSRCVERDEETVDPPVSGLPTLRGGDDPRVPDIGGG